MNKRVIYLWALVFFFGTVFSVKAQERKKTEVNTELGIVWAFAHGSFGDNIDRPLPGVVLSFGGKTPNLPLVLSTEIGWLNYGYDNHLELRYPNGSNTPSTSVVNIDAANSILMAHLVAQFVPFEGIITPHIDGLLGFKYLSTGIDVESEAVLNDSGDDLLIFHDNRLRTSSNFDSFTISYGFGAGVNIQIFDGKLGMNKSSTRISMQLGARYLFGSEADYLSENSIQPSIDGVRFEQVESKTNILIPRLGFQLGL